MIPARSQDGANRRAQEGFAGALLPARTGVGPLNRNSLYVIVAVLSSMFAATPTLVAMYVGIGAGAGVGLA